MTKAILVVEDNELNLKLFSDLLAAHGYDPHGLRDGREAIETAHRIDPALIIMDIQLPHISGIDLIRAIRADPALAPIPVIAITAFASAGDEERIRAEGAHAYMTKPISVARFIETVKQFV